MRPNFESATLFLVIAIASWALNAHAQKVYVSDNATSAGNVAWDVKVFDNGVHKYVVGDAQGVTFSPRAVGVDSTGSIYVASFQGGGVQKLVKYSENADGTGAFAHSQQLSHFGTTGGHGPCIWGIASVYQLDVDLSDDTVVVADASGVWNTSCPSPGGRGPGSYGYISRYEGADPTLVDPSLVFNPALNTKAIGIQGLAFLNFGARTAQIPKLTIDQCNGNVYVGSQWGEHALSSIQAIEKFSKNFVQLDFWDVNDPARGVPGGVVNVVLGGLAVTSDGSVWFNDVTGGAGMGGWSSMGAIVKFDNAGQFVTRRSGDTVVSGTSRNNFSWTGGMDVDEHDVLYYAETDRVLKLSGENGDLISVFGAGEFTSAAGSLEQIAVGPEPSAGSAIWTQ